LNILSLFELLKLDKGRFVNMVQNPEDTPVPGLQFFGQISASISHELKNVLAIINENAGLLEDFTLMADRGVPLEPARLKTMAESVKKQISRADAIISNMNRLAHSTDQPLATVDLAQTIETVMAVTARFALMQGIQINLQLPQNPVALQTAPFFLMNLIWLCLEFSMSAAGDEKQVELVAEETAGGVRIRFRRLAGLTEALLDTFPSDREKHLLQMLTAEFKAELEPKEIVLELTKR
jgi:C4-dicarboxylate-specific signal transduction histidine kinase